MTLLGSVVLLGLLVFVVLYAPVARAGDYAIAYALDVEGRKETGIVDKCDIRAGCEIRFRTQAISIWLSSIGRDQQKVDIAIYGSRPGCCFFNDGVRSVSRSLGSLVGLYIYEGHARKRNEFVENAHLGALFLRFSETK